MLEKAALPPMSEIVRRLGLPEPRRGRLACPLCSSDNPSTLSIRADKFHCFKCGAYGDQIDFLRAFLQTDFIGALQFLGLEPGSPPPLNPDQFQRQRALDGLKNWAAEKGRTLRMCHREMLSCRESAVRMLRRDCDNAAAWELLTEADQELWKLEAWLDLLDGDNPGDHLKVFEEFRVHAQR